MEKIIIINGKETDYLCNDLGQVFSLKRGHKLELTYNLLWHGYYMCYLYVDGKRHDLLLHRIIASTFVSNPSNKKQVNHKNGIKTDNRAVNLEWVSQSQNIKHAYDNKLMTKTFKDCYNALLSEEQVRQIRIMIKNKMKQRSIANIFNVSEQIISRIKRNKGYVGVGIISKGEAIDVNTLEINPYK